MNEYSEDEKNEIRKNLLCSIENNFYSTEKSIEEKNITSEDYNKIKANISLYKLATENILMRKKLDILESEINQLKEIINNFK